MNEETAVPQPRDRRAFNAYRHGLSGQVLIIPPAEKAAYEKHCRGIQESLAPQGALEIDLAQSVADDRWRIHRAAAMESNIFALGLNEPDSATGHHEEVDTALAMARVWLASGKDIQLLTLYESRIQRRVEKNLALIRQLQQDRRAALQQAVEQAAILGESYDFPAEALPPQFDRSNSRFAVLVAHHRSLTQAATPRDALPKTLRRAA